MFGYFCVIGPAFYEQIVLAVSMMALKIPQRTSGEARLLIPRVYIQRQKIFKE